MKYFAIFDEIVATIFQLQWNVGNIPDISLQYSVLCGPSFRIMFFCFWRVKNNIKKQSSSGGEVGEYAYIIA